MARCQWKPKNKWLQVSYAGCPHEPEEGYERCIFHLSLEEKRENSELAEKFKQEFRRLYEKGDWDFTGFVFPDNMDLSKKAGYDFRRPHEIDRPDAKEGENAGPVIFRRAEFGNEVNFNGAQFGSADFRYAEFKGHAVFMNAEFGGDADFRSVKFRGNANFMTVDFKSVAEFCYVEFRGFADFWDAEFWGYADFSKVIFCSGGWFKETRFNQSLDFSLVKGRVPAYEGHGGPKGAEPAWELELFQPGPPELVFEKTQFNGPTQFIGVDLSRTRFQQVDLSNISFLHSQISQTKFISCLWGDGPEKTKLWHRSDKKRYGFRRPRLLFDELLWRKKAALKEVDEGQTKETEAKENDPIDQVNLTEPPYNDLQASDIEVLALQLKQSLEATRDPIPAGDFHFAAMEMKREQDLEMWRESKKAVREGKQNEKAWSCRSRAWGFWWYKMISGYGECYGRTILWLGLWLLGFAVLYWWLGGLCPEQVAKKPNFVWPPPDLACVREVWYAFAFSVQHILPFKLAANYIQPTGANADWIQGLAMLETLWGTTLFAFFALALRRRFKR